MTQGPEQEGILQKDQVSLGAEFPIFDGRDLTRWKVPGEVREFTQTQAEIQLDPGGSVEGVQPIPLTLGVMRRDAYDYGEEQRNPGDPEGGFQEHMSLEARAAQAFLSQRSNNYQDYPMRLKVSSGDIRDLSKRGWMENPWEDLKFTEEALQFLQQLRLQVDYPHNRGYFLFEVKPDAQELLDGGNLRFDWYYPAELGKLVPGNLPTTFEGIPLCMTDDPIELEGIYGRFILDRAER